MSQASWIIYASLTQIGHLKTNYYYVILLCAPILAVYRSFMEKKTSWINFELEQRVYLSKFKLYSLLQTLFGEKFGND